MMKSYSFNPECNPDVWNLFKGIKEMGSGFAYSLELFDSALAGEIPIARYKNEDEIFNLCGYARKCEKNNRVSSNRRRKKVYRIDDSEEFGSISEDTLTAFVEQKDEYEKLVDEDSVFYSASEINRLAKHIMIEHRIDIHMCLEQALKGIPESVQVLRELTGDNKYIGELLFDLLSSGYSMEKLLKLEV